MILSKKTNTPKKSLTPKEKSVLEFLESYFSEHAMAPSFREIKDHFGYASYFSVQRYLKKLEEKAYIAPRENNEKRGIQLIASSDELSSKTLASASLQQREEADSSQVPSSLSLPLLGKVAAGSPLEHIKHDEYLDVPLSMIKQSKDSFALQVEGDSMIEDGIFDGDFLIVEKCNSARAGETIVAMVEGEATVKHFYQHTKASVAKLNSKQKQKVGSGLSIELRPANSKMESMFFHPSKVEIQGKLVGLLRSY